MYKEDAITVTSANPKSLLIQEKKSGPNFKITKGVSKDIRVTDNRV